MKSCSVKVSVIMPAYNAEASIGRAIQSVLAQKGVSFELLIGDDASTDATWAKVKAYREHECVRAFRFRKNMGVSVISNYLIDKARGEYISTCDADDILLPENLSIQAKTLNKNPTVGVVYGDLLVSTRKGPARITRRFRPKNSWDLLGGYFSNGGTLIRRTLIKKIGGYRPEFRFLEDCDLFVRLSELTRFYYNYGKPLYHQMKSPGSLSDRPKKQLKKVSQAIFCDAIKRRYGYDIKW